eukprot:11179948-Heterocapsa_arctica.AAC.1
MFDVVNNSRSRWVPHGAIYHRCNKVWKDVLTEQMFWHMILHTKKDKEGYYGYMIKYWPKMSMVFIKPTPKGGLGAEAANKRKHEELEQAKTDKGKGGYKGGQWGA